jgi:hypothetical protein
MHPLDLPHGHFFGGGRRRAVLVQLSRLGFRDVVVVRPRITICCLRPNGRLISISSPARTTGSTWPTDRLQKFFRCYTLLCLGPCPEQARDIQPDVQAKGVDGTHASNSCTTREFC